jgi:hypothetical protein
MSFAYDIHPVLRAVEIVRAALKDVSDVNPGFMSTGEQREALHELAAARAQVEELELRVMAAAAPLADQDSCRDIAAWQTWHNHYDQRTARAQCRLAVALDRRHEAMRAAMAQGLVHTDQAHIITQALDNITGDVDHDTLTEAEAMLIGWAGEHDPTRLQRLGRRILDTLRPDTADQILARKLANEETGAWKATRLTSRSLGEGVTRITATVPNAIAHRLGTYLDAFTSPRHNGLNDAGTGSTGTRGVGSYPKARGRAFCTLLERLNPDVLPEHGGTATTVMVTISLDALRADLGAGQLTDGDGPGGTDLTANQVRRLACSANIIPAVLGSKSQVLDLGRSGRLFTPAQRHALLLRNPTCQAEGCTIPGTWCESHHWQPWSHGGATNLTNAVLLCAFHHHRTHDPAYQTTRTPRGTITIHPRK